MGIEVSAPADNGSLHCQIRITILVTHRMTVRANGCGMAQCVLPAFSLSSVHPQDFYFEAIKEPIFTLNQSA
jgi:hypothetical protein